MNLELLKVLPQYLFPQHLLSQLLGRLADKEMGSATELFISWFAKHYEVEMEDAENSDLKSYKTFNAFFTRALRDDVREICGEGLVASPVDGAVSQAGRIRENYLIQAKGHDYTTVDLLGGDKELAEKFDDGNFATMYLAPKDYHRIHMPIAGTLVGMKHVPGRLFSVNPLTTRNIPRLFARNERVVCLFKTPMGLVAIVAVGATVVGSIETIWHGTVTPPTANKVSDFHYEIGDAVALEKGDEMGCFKLGSTVILLFEKGAVTFNEKMKAEVALSLGEAIGQIKK